MEKTLFITIGGIGTGMPLLTKYLGENRQALKKQGIRFFGLTDIHGDWGGSVKSPCMQEEDDRNIRSTLQDINHHLRESSWHTGIIGIMIPAGDRDAALVRELIPEGIAVKVIYYAQRQDELIESWYNRSIASPVCRYAGRLDDDLIGSLSGLLDHTAVIRPWAEIFGRGNIILRCCEPGQINGIIVEDVSRVIGIRPDPSLRAPGAHGEKEYCVYHTEFLRICNIHTKNNPEIHRFLRSQFSRSRLIRNLPRRHLLSPAKRREILMRYDQSNRTLARYYLNREHGSLFSSPWPDPREPWEPFIGLQADELAPIIMELIYEQEAWWDHPKQPLTMILGCVNTVLKKVPVGIPSGNDGAGIPGRPGQDGSRRQETPGPVFLHPARQNPWTVDELVPLVAETMYRRNLQLQEERPLLAVLDIINYLLARVVARVPNRMKTQAENRLGRGWFNRE